MQPGIEEGAFHYTCNDTVLFVDADTKLGPGFNAAEMVEVYEAAINNSWDCNFANGESLSRALATELHPPLERLGMTDNAVEWFSKGAYDYVSTNLESDLDHEANGCGTLFLEYLHDGLGYDWKSIIANGADTLAETYSKLTGSDPTAAFPRFIEALQPFIHGNQLNPPERGKSWDVQAQEIRHQEKEREITKKAIEIASYIGLGGALLAALLLVAQRYKEQQRALGQANPQPQPQIELPVINAGAANNV